MSFLLTVIAADFVAYFGYGNVAGFLVNKGIAFQPPPPESVGDVDLISGQAGHAEDRPAYLDWTEEEKEREAERLFVLFDRMNRTGVMKVQLNPSSSDPPSDPPSD